MFSRRVQYFILLFSVLTYYAASGEWLSWVLLLTVAGLPWLSLLLSLPAIWNFQASPAGAEVLEQGEIIRIYAASGKVFAVTNRGEYTMRLRLYEVEERLNPDQFVRISNSEIINLKRVKNFDLSFTGTICVELTNGTTAFVSRRYVSKIKKILGI